MDLNHLKKFKPHQELKIIEKDLSKDEKVRRKVQFDESDLRIDHSRERLKKCEIEIPIFSDSYIRPFFLKGKLLRYEVKNLGGGFYEFKFVNGKFEPKPRDRRHSDEDIGKNREGETIFWIGYNHEKQHYYYIESEETFLEKYQVIENAILSTEVIQTLNDFEIFISTFWTTDYLIKNNWNKAGASNTTIKNYYDMLLNLKNALPMLKKYHHILNIFGDINDPTNKHIQNTFDEKEKEVLELIESIENNLDPTDTVNDLRGNKYPIFQPIERFFSKLDTNFYTRGFYVDPFEKDVFPNFLEVHYQRQLSEDYENNETLKERKQEVYDNWMEKVIKLNFVQFVPKS